MIHQGYKLRQLIKEGGFKQSEFAEKLGISRVYLISLFEKRNFPEEHLRVAIKVLNINKDVVNQPVEIKGKKMIQALGEPDVQSDIKKENDSLKREMDTMRSEIITLKKMVGLLEGELSRSRSTQRQGNSG